METSKLVDHEIEAEMLYQLPDELFIMNLIDNEVMSKKDLPPLPSTLATLT